MQEQLLSAAAGSESESEADLPPASASTSERKRKRVIFPDSEGEEQHEPIRAAKLKSYLTRRVGSGYTMQSDPTRRGEFYIEVRISNCRELDAISTNRWKNSLLCFKTAVNDNSPTWKAVTQLVGTVKEDYSSIQPILYPQNPFLMFYHNYFILSHIIDIIQIL